MGLMQVGLALAVAAGIPMVITRLTGTTWTGGYTWRTALGANRFALLSLLAPYMFLAGLAIAGVGVAIGVLQWAN